MPSTNFKLTRKRKTKDPCPECFLHKSFCICEVIPRLTLKTKIALIVHAKELKRTTNTGRLAIKSLLNSEMRVRGEGRDKLDLSDLLSEDYRTFLFYPADDALELTQDLVSESHIPIQLLVPDGNWRQAGKVHGRHPELSKIPRVKISTPNLAKYHLRNESTPEGMATLEAIAQALLIIEGKEVFDKVMAVYEAKLKNTLISRGVTFPA